MNGKYRQRGVTLIELVVVTVIVGILAAIAIPSYRIYILRSQRSDAKDAVLALATQQEKHYLQCNAYADVIDAATDCAASELQSVDTSKNGWYDLTTDATDADPTLGCERRESAEVLDVVPRDVQGHGPCDPRVAGDRGRILDLLECVPRDASLREHAEPRAGVDEAPRRDLDGQLRRRPADSVEVGTRLYVHRHSRWKTSGIRVWNPVAGSVSGSISSAISACQRAFASLSAIWLVKRSKSSTSR